MVFPIVVGAGKRCFGDPGQAVALAQQATRALGPDGIVLLGYVPDGRPEWPPAPRARSGD